MFSLEFNELTHYGLITSQWGRRTWSAFFQLTCRLWFSFDEIRFKLSSAKCRVFRPQCPRICLRTLYVNTFNTAATFCQLAPISQQTNVYPQQVEMIIEITRPNNPPPPK